MPQQAASITAAAGCTQSADCRLTRRCRSGSQLASEVPWSLVRSAAGTGRVKLKIFRTVSQMGWKPIKQRRTARSDNQAQSRQDAGVAESRGHAATGGGGHGGNRLPQSTGPPPSRRPGRFRGWRGWLLRVALLVLAPLLFFGLLEGGLRVGGYGYPTGFFVRADGSGNYTTNFRFGWRFFPRSLARDPEPCVLAAKPAGAIRIFVLGSSAAMGTPDPAFSFGRILEVMLREQYPGTRLEVVNAAMTAINSQVALEIARDCAAREPDLFVVYMGNNEVVGPFGPGTVFQQWSPNLPLIRASLRVKATRVGQLLGNVVGSFRRKAGTPGSWRGMEMFLDNPVRDDDPRLSAVYANYRRNLTDICDQARHAHAGVVLASVAVNLRDCPPFASLHRSGLDPADLTQWEALCKAGGELAANQQWPEALEQYEAAAKLDGRFAELQFRIGQCLLQAGRCAEARDRFELARDLDVLRFRADSRINPIIREVATARKATGVRFVDAERALAESDPGAKGIAGGPLFHEHVHLTFDGNYLLARAMLEQVCAALPQLAALPTPGAVPSRQRCAEVLALTPWDEFQLTADMVEMTSRAPFTNQLDHRLRQAAAGRRRDELRQLAATPAAEQAAWQTYEAALVKTPADWSLHRHFGRLALLMGRPDVAVEHLQIALGKLPRDAPLHINLGNALADQGHPNEAIGHYRQALEINPDDEMAHYNLGNVLAGRQQIDEAIAHYRQALKIKPNYEGAHYNLGNVLAGRGQVDEAIVHFQQALASTPDNAEAHSNLGAMLASRGKFDDAIAHFQRALELRPDNVKVRQNLERARAERARIPPAPPRPAGG
ncbi:MAG: tetratricopeptide repeat protein [Verrucomicrobia bacterium]|nr:tetratricopeptide repeat protein [Verrucomicrobiota bacterium]